MTAHHSRRRRARRRPALPRLASIVLAGLVVGSLALYALIPLFQPATVAVPVSARPGIPRGVLPAGPTILPETLTP